MNPLKNIIKIKDLEKILMKFNNEYIIETFTEEAENQKNKIQNLICQITFPLMREVLHQKFPMEKRANLHMKTAKILSTSKNLYILNY
jgi:peptide subunit release factor RF-3